MIGVEMIQTFSYNLYGEDVPHLSVLILEDDENRIEKFKKKLSSKSCLIHWANNAQDCMYLLEKAAKGGTKFTNIFLDHDLGGRVMTDGSEPDSGSEVARWFETHPELHTAFVNTTIIIHSFNPDRARYMQDRIPGSTYVPGVWDKLS
jgi:CheY-like chemotaxis protein